MDTNKIYELCYIDRENTYGKTKKIFRKMNLDLLIKLVFLYINSIGIKQNCKEKMILFVDEINNMNSKNNLNNTFGNIEFEHKYFLNFNEIKGKNHFKIGFLAPILNIVILILEMIFFVPIYLISLKKYQEIVMKMCINRIKRVLRKYSDLKIVVMSDHHFFSTICSVICSDSYVLQHGLIMQKEYYYPIRASHFCAWGEHTYELLNNDSKIIITGTYKFDDLKKTNTTISKNISKKTYLFFFSSLDEKKVEYKIKTLYKISKDLGFNLSVKCHQGSLFDLKYWKDLFKGCDITFYKEENISELDFDLAISENSTVILDLIMMNKSFIIFDDSNGYFGNLFDIIPNGNDEKSVSKSLSNIEDFNFNELYEKIIKYEINNNKCILNELLGEKKYEK